jgi:hypothetical protein
VLENTPYRPLTPVIGIVQATFSWDTFVDLIWLATARVPSTLAFGVDHDGATADEPLDDVEVPDVCAPFDGVDEDLPPPPQAATTTLLRTTAIATAAVRPDNIRLIA